MNSTAINLKPASKGLEEIAIDNEKTLNYYRILVFVANCIYFTTMMGFSAFTPRDIGFLLWSGAVYSGCYHYMCYIARTEYDDSGQLTDSGADLNMEGGISEHIKSVMILTAICQVLSAYSNYFWLLWLVAIIKRALMLLWSKVLSPYLYQSASAEDDKKRN